MTSSNHHDVGRLQLQLENQIARATELGRSRAEVAGTLSPTAIGLILSQLDRETESVQLVITSTPEEAERVTMAFKFFAPQQKLHSLNSFDLSPYSGLPPKINLSAKRCGFLWAAQNARGGDVFVTHLEALLQKTLTYDVFRKRCVLIKQGQNISINWNERLGSLGYQLTPTVEDVGQYAVRGGIVDVFSPNYSQPLRIELFGDEIESLRFYDPITQRSVSDVASAELVPCREFFWDEVPPETYIDLFRESLKDRPVPASEKDEALRALARNNLFDGIDFLFSYFAKKTASVLEHFSVPLRIWSFDPLELSRLGESFSTNNNEEYKSSTSLLVRPEPKNIWFDWDKITWPGDSFFVDFYSVETRELTSQDREQIEQLAFPTYPTQDLKNSLKGFTPGSAEWVDAVAARFRAWKKEHFSLFLSVRTVSQAERLRVFLARTEFQCASLSEHSLNWASHREAQIKNPNLIHLLVGQLPESQRLPAEKLIFLNDDDLWGKKTGITRAKPQTAQDEFQKAASRLSFSDLNPGDYVVHTQHGIGIYDGLKSMDVQGVLNEFIQISYKDKDKLYLPVYRIAQLNRYSGHAAQIPLDRLGSGHFEKTKIKVKSALTDLAAELLKLYALRSEATRPAYNVRSSELQSFEAQFPFDETVDQLKAVQDLTRDLASTKPMDRLICGDVGFGKTEVAMRAAFVAASNGKQVALLCPTTVLTFQHFETLKKRFADWPFTIRSLNRFVAAKDVKTTLKEVKEGKVDILVGTHRLLSKDVEFKNLGLLIVDEEQKFGVAAKEKIRKAKSGIDTLAMSATPIPRSLNMSLMNVRDLSLINTAPVDRLPTRTFVTRWDIGSIRKAILAEVQRGGQIYFIHNRVQSIYEIAAELREALPDLRIGIGHGQLPEEELEKTMVSFFNHEIDMLVCTTIVESGMDVTKANTMFIDQAHTLGLSQLYQLRGRVGRSKQRAYCYLLTPRGRQLEKLEQERLKVIQENSALGSGIRIAQYDLELRGAGNILGEAQSGHVDSVGYELYMDLLNDAVADLKGEAPGKTAVEPEINLRIQALIPDAYISDIRVRLSYYRALADIESPQELEKIEAELSDQFGALPEPVLNLMGVMLIRYQCRKLFIKDLSAGTKNVTLSFTADTPLTPAAIIKLASQQNKKFTLLPDNRVSIRMNEITWSQVHDELNQLMSSARVGVG
jgi:transcription-repair coupling factor (superfamily II helicase)